MSTDVLTEPPPHRAERAMTPRRDEVPAVDRNGEATGRRPSRLVRWVLFIAVLGYAALLRTWDLGSLPFWVDEAESAINALTILDHGVPVDHYLGLPIYENTLTRPWPEHPEYEFKDSSYSKKGLAIYHGWLPLYSIAGAYAVARVEPDRDGTNLSVKHSPREMRRRTIVGRLPGVAFGVAFVVFAFLAARAMYGSDAGWVALLTATVCTSVIDFARQARYYSTTLALTTCCCLMIWLMLRRGRWRDFLLGGVVFSLLFHSHMLSFAVACGACALLVPSMFRHERAVPKMLACGAIVALAVFPWAYFSGFFGATSDIPSARKLLVFPHDYLAYPRRRWMFVTLAALTLVWLVVAHRMRDRLPKRLVQPFYQHRTAFFFLAAWATLALLAFLLLMPAASFFYGRLTLMLMGPGLLFGAMMFTAAGRVVSRRWAFAIGAGLFLLCLAVFGRVTLWKPAMEPWAYTTYDVAELLRERSPFDSGTKLYATPNYHLPMTFYTGIPVGNVAAVRKSYLDNYEGELVILEAGPYYDWLTWQEIRAEAAKHGYAYTDRELWDLEPRINTRLVRERLVGKVAEVYPPLEPAPPYLPPLLELQRQKTRKAVGDWIWGDGNPMLWGYPMDRYSDWWPVFFFRFVGVEQRSGPNLNYAERARESHATVMPQGWTVFHCPPRPDNSSQFTSEKSKPSAR